ncbi:two-component system, CitB family, response regulator [Malonomonas rubra DSM 5091]|uniref:Transcriptional regulatory protein n=1 Tax=Malonomonas rubra DSM 5091 TaxID=1122189 RepID=A0A1M6FCJ0_MALRU|nr:response regulator [Malonomonas rubra]SHI95474.1 two-component system, CitB family, response regulator [Malonomonas rubra DSM 5091]
MADNKVRVLVVEDDMRISELHQRFVEKLPQFEVVGLANAIADAAEMVEILQPDLVLLDLFFPEGNGMDLLKRIRSSEQPCDVILITAAREMSSLQEALRRGVFDYIIKPVFFPRFQEALQKYYDYFCQLQKGGALDQRDVDRLLHAHRAPEVDTGAIPKGIDSLTLTKVRNVFDDPSVTDLNAEEVGKAVGISRSTARRYLEFLATEGFLKADLIYGVVGRPERRYLRND